MGILIGKLNVDDRDHYDEDPETPQGHSTEIHKHRTALVEQHCLPGNRRTSSEVTKHSTTALPVCLANVEPLLGDQAQHHCTLSAWPM